MRTGSVSILDVIQQRHRLTGGFHIAEDEQAVARLRRFQGRSEPVGNLARHRGIFSGPIFKGVFTEDPAGGEPYVSARELVNAHVSPTNFLSLKDQQLLDVLRLHEGMILVTCSGMNLGRAIWVRSDIGGLIGSGDLIRIHPDAEKVPPGYLYAFLASRYGHALIRKQIYGGHIKHVDPAHIADLVVPRLGEAVEHEAHRLNGEAAKQRAEATSARATLLGRVTACLGWSPRPAVTLDSSTSSSTIQRRLDAFHHGSGIRAARELLATGNSQPLGSLVEDIFEPGRGVRQKVEDPSFGIPFLSSSEVFRLDPVGNYLISRHRTPHLERHLVTERDLLLPRSGQVGGIIGRAVLPLPSYYGSAASEHLVRIRCKSREDAFLAWAVFATQPGYYAAIGTAFGSSIPSLDCGLLADLRIPWWTGGTRDELVSLVGRMINALTDAIRAERAARALVERAIEEGV